MSVTVTLYSFTKRENSTKQPISGGTDYSCIMMDDTSLMNPTFKLSIASNPIGKNYAYVADFNRYYFITDISTYQNFWYISCTCDVLASFKTEIGTGSHYVLRSASDSDGNISDTMYPAKINSVGSTTFPSSQPMSWANGHSYVIGVVGFGSNSTKQIGSLVYYHMDNDALLDFLTFLMDNVDDWSDLTGEYSQGVNQALLNPMQYIKSCICLPVDPPRNPPSGSDPRASSIQFGYYHYTIGPSGGNIYEITNSAPTALETCTIAIPRHPQAATRGNYLNCQPFSTYTLHLGPLGDVPLDPSLLQRNTNIKISMLYDLTTGMCRVIVQGNEYAGDIFFSGTCQAGVNINLSQVYVDGLAQTKVETDAIFSMLGAGLSGNIGAIASIMGTATSGIQDATRLNFPSVSGIGNGGSFLPYFDSANCFLSFKYVEIVDENNAENGRPLCKTKQINTLSGYILCINADCQIPGTADEAQKVNAYMNGGFFYE